MLIDYKKVNIWQDDKQVLSNVDFNVDEGEFVYLIGKVGSGKSSLLKSIYFELDVNDAETAIVLDHNLLNLKRKHVPALRRQMGIIFQDFQLLGDRTVRENLRFVLKSTGWKDKKKIDQRIHEVLTDVGLTDKQDKLPHELSGGEQQRVAIARAILNNPKVILADEPTGHLDPETASNIVELLKDISATGTAIVMSTHNITLLERYPGIVYRCRDGVLENITDDSNGIVAELDV